MRLHPTPSQTAESSIEKANSVPNTGNQVAATSVVGFYVRFHTDLQFPMTMASSGADPTRSDGCNCTTNLNPDWLNCTLESEYISHGEPRRGRGNEEVRSVAGVHRQGLEPHWPFLVGFAITGALIVKFTAAPADEDAKNSRFVQELNRSDVASKQKVGLQAVASNQEADGYFCSRSHASGSGNNCRWFTLLNGFREEKILSQPIRDVQLVRHKGIELLGWRRSQPTFYKPDSAETIAYQVSRVPNQLCFHGRILVQEHACCRKLESEFHSHRSFLVSYSPAGELSALYITLISCFRGQEGRVGERADGHRVHAASPTEAPAPSNRRPRRGTGAPWSFAYADVDAVYKRSGTGEPAPGKELGANAGLRARHGWQRGSLEELLGGCPSSYVAKPGPIRWSYLSL
ncbi:hypothetical protein MUK42_33252 [Musa troglodytarum]|uniref:Uncharacterized protein n=1 Tax=Musa troglodytarum TaxID=320322 RepID=A0A9E7L917_9LILI|nr:hypothetical protein MUK42_33252 [Musa troglodytarum]